MQIPFFGWRVVAGAFVLAVFGWGFGFYGPPVYLHQVQAERGWSTVLVSTAVTLHFLVGGRAGTAYAPPPSWPNLGFPRLSTSKGSPTLQ